MDTSGQCAIAPGGLYIDEGQAKAYVPDVLLTKKVYQYSLGAP